MRFWDVASGRETGRVDTNPGWVRSLAYSPDGKALAIASGYTLKLWDVIGNQPGTTLEPSGFLVQSVAFAPDANYLKRQPRAAHLEHGETGCRRNCCAG